MEESRLAAKARSYISKIQEQILNCPLRDIVNYTIEYTELHELEVFLISRYGSSDGSLTFRDVRCMYQVAYDHFTRRKSENSSRPEMRLQRLREIYEDLTKPITDENPNEVGKSKWHEEIMKTIRSEIANIEETLKNNRDEVAVDACENVDMSSKYDFLEQKDVTVPTKKKPKHIEITQEITPKKMKRQHPKKSLRKKEEASKCVYKVVGKIYKSESKPMQLVYGKNQLEEIEQTKKEVNSEAFNNKEQEDKPVDETKQIESENQGQDKDVEINSAQKVDKEAEVANTRQETLEHATHKKKMVEDMAAMTAECSAGRRKLIKAQRLYAVLKFQLQKPKEPDKMNSSMFSLL